MKRRHTNICFALVVALSAVWTGIKLIELQRGKAINHAVNTVSAGDEQPDQAEAQLAWAVVQSQNGEFESAENTLTRLIRLHPQDPIGEAAQYNLANVYMREGMRADSDPASTKPMIELAKQRYRDLLRQVPDNWDARYNLERALRLAPEHDQSLLDDRGKPIKRVKVVVPDFKTRDLP